MESWRCRAIATEVLREGHSEVTFEKILEENKGASHWYLEGKCCRQR